MSSDLFSISAAKSRLQQPLAERMRPQSLAEFVGQQHIVGAGRILADLAPGRSLPSLLFWGPPGSGKTTLAKLCGLALHTELIALSAVDSGVKDIREAVANAAAKRNQFGRRTLLFIDEIHRFSRSQQDALLPHVENGTVTLLGATTENPSFGVVAALLSRCRVIRLHAHTPDDLTKLAQAALTDNDRGLAALRPIVEPEILGQLVLAADGDARRMFAMLEISVDSARRDADRGQQATATVTAHHVAEAAQGKNLLYDRAGDEHYGVVSAFIKSMRGSDANAAMYWMTRMLEAGEDPRFILRRLVIFASEDVGNADPQALQIAVSALQAFELMGLPEGALPLTQATTYLALAPKSNRVLTAYAAARKLVREHGSLPVPAKLRNVTGGLGPIEGMTPGPQHGANQRTLESGANYKYPHDFAGHYVPETYLPDQLAAADPPIDIYQPSSSGFEATLAQRIATMALAVHGSPGSSELGKQKPHDDK
jgi:putative ATPase